MKKTKILAFILASILCIAMLASCSDSTGDDNTAYDDGYEAGYSEGYEIGYEEGYYGGYEEGYYYGYENGIDDVTFEGDSTIDDSTTDDVTIDDGTIDDTVTD